VPEGNHNNSNKINYHLLNKPDKSWKSKLKLSKIKYLSIIISSIFLNNNSSSNNNNSSNNNKLYKNKTISRNNKDECIQIRLLLFKIN